jgi:hypothetical protein
VKMRTFLGRTPRNFQKKGEAIDLYKKVDVSRLVT